MKYVNYLRLMLFCFSVFLLQNVSAADLGEMLSGYTPSGSGYDSAWSVFVGGDFTIEPGAIRAGGRVFVRKNLNLSTTYEVGGIGGLGARPPDGSEALVVGDSVLGNGRVSLTAWGSYGYRARIQNTVSAGVAFGWSGEPLPLIGGVDNASADQLIAELQQKSAYWGSLSSTPGGSIIEIDNSVYISADGVNGNPQLWVYNIGQGFEEKSAAAIFEGFEPGDTILINVSKGGTADSFNFAPPSFLVNPEFADSINSRLIWNFPEAITVQLAGTSGFPGAFLIANPSSTTIVSMPIHRGRFVTCGNLVHTKGDGAGGCVLENYPFEGNMPDLPAELLVTEITALPDQMISVVFNSESGLIYQVMTCEELGELWLVESVKYPIESGFSALSNQPFTARAGATTEVLIPRNGRAQAFFKIIQAGSLR